MKDTDTVDEHWTCNMVTIVYWSSLIKPWVVICPADNYTPLNKFGTLDEAKDYCRRAELELVYWPLVEG